MSERTHAPVAAGERIPEESRHVIARLDRLRTWSLSPMFLPPPGLFPPPGRFPPRRFRWDIRATPKSRLYSFWRLNSHIR